MYKILDTNIILSDASNLHSLALDGSVIVLPETVIHELDSKKSGFEEINFQAREFARLMTEATLLEDPKVDGNYTVTKLLCGTAQIHVVASIEYPEIDNSIPSNIVNDQKIISIASAWTTKYGMDKVVFLSLDLMCRISARAVGVITSVPDIKVVEPIQLLKSIEIESNLFNSMEGKPISNYDPTYTIGNFSYEFISSDGNSKRAIIVNGKIDSLKEDEFTKLPVKPVNMKQKLWCKALLSDAFSINILEAKAGTGKNLTSLSCAMALIDKNPKYTKIIYIRNSIESVDKGADIGYLSGNDEKFRIYNMPLYDTLDFIAKSKCRSKVPSREEIDEKVTEITTKYAIETIWVGEMRGRTLSNALVILDEWQNSSKNTTQLVISRLDDSCKAIVIGSNRQIDNAYLNKYNNGLTALKNDLVVESNLSKFSIDLDKAVRGRFAEYAETLFSK